MSTKTLCDEFWDKVHDLRMHREYAKHEQELLKHLSECIICSHRIRTLDLLTADKPGESLYTKIITSYKKYVEIQAKPE